MVETTPNIFHNSISIEASNQLLDNAVTTKIEISKGYARTNQKGILLGKALIC